MNTVIQMTGPFVAMVLATIFAVQQGKQINELKQRIEKLERGEKEDGQ